MWMLFTPVAFLLILLLGLVLLLLGHLGPAAEPRPLPMVPASAKRSPRREEPEE